MSISQAAWDFNYCCPGLVNFWQGHLPVHCVLQNSTAYGDIREAERDFPGGPVVKNPPYSAGDMGSIPGQGTKIPHAAGQLSPRATNYRAHAPWSLCTTTREEKNLHATTRQKPARRNERSHVTQLRPDAAKNK